MTEDKKETMLIEAIVKRMEELELKEETIKAVVAPNLLPTNEHLEKMLTKLNSWTNPTDGLVLAAAHKISEDSQV